MTAGKAASIWPLLIYFLSALSLVGAILSLSHLLGERHRERESYEIYESGIVPLGTACLNLDVKFYLVAVFFVIMQSGALRQVSYTGSSTAEAQGCIH